MSAIVDFLEGRGRDGAGRTLDDVLALDSDALERRHDFIQWIFPLPEASQAVPGSPVLSPADVADLRASPEAQRNLARAATRMGAFYAETSHWLAATDHNHLRITRIVRSLRLLIGDADADGFRAAILRRVEAAAAPVSAVSRAYWSEA